MTAPSARGLFRAPPMLNGWFVWDKRHRGETTLRMLDRHDVRQGELLEQREGDYA